MLNVHLQENGHICYLCFELTCEYNMKLNVPIVLYFVLIIIYM